MIAGTNLKMVKPYSPRTDNNYIY